MSTSYIYSNDIGRYNNLSDVSALRSKEDVATLLDTYKSSGMGFIDVEGVVEHPSGNYFLVIDRTKRQEFDLFGYINEKYKGEHVNCANANMLFPRSISRGVFEGSLDSLNTPVDDEDVATSYIDMDEANNDFGLELLFVRDNIRVKVPEGGLVVGRSAKRADFVISNNLDISRSHCRVYRSGKNFVVSDEGSLNGTYVNGMKVSQGESVVLKEGDIITLAGEQLKVL